LVVNQLQNNRREEREREREREREEQQGRLLKLNSECELEGVRDKKR